MGDRKRVVALLALALTPLKYFSLTLRFRSIVSQHPTPHIPQEFT